MEKLRIRRRKCGIKKINFIQIKKWNRSDNNNENDVYEDTY